MVDASSQRNTLMAWHKPDSRIQDKGSNEIVSRTEKLQGKERAHFQLKLRGSSPNQGEDYNGLKLNIFF